MNGARLGLSLVLLAVPALCTPLVLRARHPSAWAMVAASSLGAGFVLFEVSLIHASLPLAFTLLGLDGLARACRQLGGHLFGAAPPFSAMAGVTALVVLIRAGRGLHRLVTANQLLHEGRELGTRAAVGNVEVVSVPFTERLALAVPGASPLVLVSRGVLANLALSEVAVVVRHEVAHLRHRHIRFLLVGAAVRSGLGFLPWVGWSEDSLRLALERWADEEAADGQVERWEHVKSALAKLSAGLPRADEGTVAARVAAAERAAARVSGVGAWSWRTVAAAVFPMAAALLVTLVVHLADVLRVAGAST